MGEVETVVLITKPDGKVLRVFRLATKQLGKRTEDDIINLAQKYGQLVEFHPVTWAGIEALKWDLKEMNGDT